MNIILDWAISNKIELIGTIIGVFYIWFSVRQSLLTWPAGIITSILYCYVFFGAKLYAGMGLQFYYVVMSCYGWWSWSHGENSESGRQVLQITNASWALLVKLFVLNLFLTTLVYYTLGKLTDSPVPFGDALTTSLGIIATWMMARKKLEHWLIWIFADLISISLYLYQELYSTVVLFLIYTVMASIGYYQWQKEPEKILC